MILDKNFALHSLIYITIKTCNGFLEQVKAIIFDMMIDLAEKEFNIPIRKKCSPEQLPTTGKNKKKL